jgi:hypothetical protein
MFSSLKATVSLAVFLSLVSANPIEPEPQAASCTFPSPPKTSSLTAARTIAAGQTFDGGNVRFDRGSGACQGQTEGGDSDAVFLLQQGATLQ